MLRCRILAADGTQNTCGASFERIMEKLRDIRANGVARSGLSTTCAAGI
jgi:hypothetical protein